MKLNKSNDESKQPIGRGNKPGKARPWLWIEKAGRRMIRDIPNRFDSTFSVPAALLVYDGLCEIASDEASCTFEASLDHIRKVAGVSVRTVQRILPVLEQLKLLGIERSYQPDTYLKAPSRYTILAMGHSDLSIGQSRKQVSVAVSRRTSEESKKGTARMEKKREEAEVRSLADDRFNSETGEYEF